ncbi:MAG: hypothetical protein G01um101417_10 [Parcubacteria group bacterium Gr01-1014_17]|nr:MAG: hypothetical protein G01um101417_10 [Parcubacteria group bacterium Gr01-1014_17]
MIPDIFISILFTPSFSFAFFVWLIAHYTLVKHRMEGAGRISATIALTLTCWFVLVIVISKTRLFAINPLFAPNIAFGFLLLFELLRRVYSSKTIQRIAENAPIALLMGIQIYRILGISFLTLYSQNLLPAAFAIPAGWGDILVGVTAPFVAALYYFGKPYGKKLAIIWNYVGILDLIVAIGVGTLAFPRPIQFMHTTPSTELFAMFPMAIVPLFAVPLSFVLHMLCLRVLKGNGTV